MNILTFFVLFLLSGCLNILCFKKNNINTIVRLNPPNFYSNIGNKKLKKKIQQLDETKKFVFSTKLFSSISSASNINLQLLKYVRNVTNASIQVCNNALKLKDNDAEKAIEYIRKNVKNVSISTHIKTKKEGLVIAEISEDNKKIAILEVLTDSDFVSKNKIFVKFIKQLIKIILKNGEITDFTDVTNLLKLQYIHELEDTNMSQNTSEENNNKKIMYTVEEQLHYLRSIFKEYIQIGKCKTYVKQDKNELLHFYIHNKIEENVGILGAILALKIDNLEKQMEQNKKQLYDFANDIAMHIISAKPISLSIDTLSHDIKKKEIDLIKESLKNIKKPKNIIDNMINGKMKKFYNKMVLLEQEYMLDESKKNVSQVIEDFAKKYKTNVTIQFFDYISVGEKNVLRD